MLRVLQISDIHFGAKYKFLTQQASIQRSRVLDAYQRAIDTAIDKNCNIFLVAGDTFDSPYPSEEYIKAFNEGLQKLSSHKIYTGIISGNHDYFKSGSVFDSGKIHEDDFVKVFKPSEKDGWKIDNIDVTIYGISISSKTSNVSPLTQIVRDNDSRLNVGLIHGGVQLGNLATKVSPISPAEIQSSNLDYIALGDWHGMLDVSQKDTKAWYSGSPEMISSSQEKMGSVLLVEIEKEDVKVIPIKVGRTYIKTVEIDITDISKLDQVVALINRYEEKDLVLEVILKGDKSLMLDFDVSLLLEKCQKNFFYLKIKDNTFIQIDKLEEKIGHENLLTTSFVTAMKDLKDQDGVAEEEYERALQFGLSILVNPNQIKDL